jgi:hypothetical protein
MYGFLVLLRQGLHVVALLGQPLRCRDLGFRPWKTGLFHPTSHSTTKMEVNILTLSTISLPLKILSLAKLDLMKV